MDTRRRTSPSSSSRHSVLLVLLFTTIAVFAPHSVSALKCNGVERFCSTPYNQITFKGTHNSFSVSANSFAANHRTNLEAQLNGGVRYVNLDLHRKKNTADIHVCHNDCDNPIFLDAGVAKDFLSGIAAWLAKNKNDVLTLDFEVTDQITPTEIAAIFTSTGLDKFAYVLQPGQWPTLGDMVNGNKRLVVFIDVAGDATFPWLHQRDQFIVFTNFRTFTLDQLTCDAAADDTKLLLMNHLLNTQLIQGDTDTYFSDSADAGKTNSYAVAKAHLDSCGGRRVNFFLVDWWDTPTKDWMKAVDDSNTARLGFQASAAVRPELSAALFTVVALVVGVIQFL